MFTQDNDEFDYQVLNLTARFYQDYPDPPYHEIIRKEARPYNCLLIQSKYEYFICIPYRSHINHSYAFKFKSSKRSKRTKSGLDYSKMVIIKDHDYITSTNAIVDEDEYKETRDNIDYIKHDAQQYINTYVNSILFNEDIHNDKQFQRAYTYSTLKYFHNELSIHK